MHVSNFGQFQSKMERANVNPIAIEAFRRSYDFYMSGASSVLRENEIDYVESLPAIDQGDVSKFDVALLKKTAVLKLNGGLGTSMGLQKAKSLLRILGEETFLDIIAKQIVHLRQTTEAEVRFLLMNSFSTSDDTLRYLAKYEDQLGSAASCEMMQNQIPKIDVEKNAPAEWLIDSSLEWCPPGHGDLYVALVGSGLLDELLADEIEYLFVSNSDNLGATLDASLLSYFAQSEAPFMMEVTRRTEADKKGGHIARRKSDGQLVLREVAQCADEDLDEFQNISKHQFFNTNNLWIHLPALKKELESCDGVLPLPVIVNKKKVDPRDDTSTPVVQLEVAMGAAIECFQGAIAIDVPRSRFAPVKTTADLFALRSDAYVLTEEAHLKLDESRSGVPPMISLSSNYKLVDSIREMNIPSLIKANSLTVSGLIDFELGVVLEGDVTFSNKDDEKKMVSAGNYKNQSLEL